MSNAARPVLQSKPDDAQSLTRLLANLATSARQGVNAALVGRPDAGQWETLNAVIDRRMARPVWKAEAFTREAPTIIEAAARRLQRIDSTRALAYVDMAGNLTQWRQAAGPIIAPAILTEHLLHALLWHTAWHLLTAGLGVRDVIGIIAAQPGRPSPSRSMTVSPANRPTEARSPAVRYSFSVEQPKRRLSATVIQSAARIVRSGVVRSVIVIFRAGARLWAWTRTAWKERQRKKAEFHEKIRQQVETVRAAQKAEAEREAAQKELERQEATRKESEAATQQAAMVADQVDAVTDPAIELDGPRLQNPIVATWMGLVLGSWATVIAMGVLAIPAVTYYETTRVWASGMWLFSPWFGPVGFEMMVSRAISDYLIMIPVGLLAVPLIASALGFETMIGARDATMRTLGFKDMGDDDPLRAVCARYAEALTIPAPRLGTIKVRNAFAMGSMTSYAVVALGTPLMEELSEPERHAVLGHELGHVVSRDVLRMTLMRTFQDALVWFAGVQGLKRFFRWMLGWWTELWILAFSREREYWADAVGAALAGKEAMIGALQKLESGPALTSEERAHARFMFRGNVFSTHPSMPQRIKALENETYLKRLPLKPAPTGAG